ncbi:MAG TPA: SDR family oxidoreductase [Polyangiaceae bacterium]|jgi:NAD(P)-dependent dehydrogenase (short-subunit alcohol dehydrogenase family)|nr:SDR family oxidoreductase [Polyangiaceae bacterium]
MQTILVTGANRGIGLELCRSFQARSDAVIAVCRRSSPELGALGARIIADVNVTDEASIATLVRALDGTRIDVLVHNAGILRAEALGSIDYDSVREQLETNALAPLRLTERLLPLLAPGGKVALMTSRMGSVADNSSGSMYGYRMSKAALNMAGASLAIDLKPKGIAVVILHPGFVNTEMTGGRGNVEPRDAARQLVARIDELTLATTGRFLHANGEVLPW